MEDRDVRIRLYQKQADFTRADALIRAFCAGIGAGKSWIGAYDVCRRAEPNGLYAVYAPTYRMMIDSTLRSFMDVVGQLGYLKSFNKNEMMATLGNGAEVIFRSLDNPERSRGPNLSGAYIDEASLVGEEAYPIILGRLRQGGKMGFLSATYTPKGKGHWTYREFAKKFEEGEPDIFHVRASTGENPFNPPDFYDKLRLRYTSIFALQELEGEYLDEGGTIARPEWFIVVPKLAASGIRVRGWDLAATERKLDMRSYGMQSHDPDYTVGLKMGRGLNDFYIENIVRGRFGPTEIEPLIVSRAREDGRLCIVAVEREPAASGKIVAAQLEQRLQGYMTRFPPSSGDKLLRAMLFLSSAEQGHVKLVDGSWVRDFKDEIGMWGTNISHDDQLDAGSLAFNTIVEQGYKLNRVNVRIGSGQKKLPIWR